MSAARRRRTGRWITLGVALALMAAVLVVHVVQGLDRTPVASGPPCQATVGDQTFALELDQAANATTIAAVGKRDGLPDHAVTIALATAMQESGLRNLSYGDRDSLGLFQQRPSQGWGTAEQVTTPTYAAAAFYQKLETGAGVADARRHRGGPEGAAQRGAVGLRPLGAAVEGAGPGAHRRGAGSFSCRVSLPRASVPSAQLAAGDGRRDRTCRRCLVADAGPGVDDRHLAGRPCRRAPRVDGDVRRPALDGPFGSWAPARRRPTDGPVAIT